MFRRFLFITPFFFTFFFMSSPAFAVNDVSYTFSDSFPVINTDLCGGSSSISCSGFNYLTISYTGGVVISENLRQIRFQLYVDSVSTYFTIFPSYAVLDISSYSRVRFNPSSSQWPSGFPYTLTFTISESPPASDCPVCPVIPEYPYDNKFDDVVTAIYTCGAIMLVLYFFYSIYRVIIKTTGGF